MHDHDHRTHGHTHAAAPASDLSILAMSAGRRMALAAAPLALLWLAVWWALAFVAPR